jgi:CheY-like chemotaxis protein
MNILVVDDDEMNKKVAKALLQPFKMSIDTAANGMEAVEKVKNNTYDLVFMDHMMPVMDGIEAVSKIRGFAGAYYASLPIVALSANATAEARALFLEAQMSDFVSKPIIIEEITKCLLRWLPEELIEGLDKEVALDRKNEIEDSMEVLPMIEGLDVEEGIRYCGSKKAFLELVGDFYRLIDTKSLKIEQLLEKNMIRDYTIEVHSLKNAARMIGAAELSELSYELEKLGNANDREQIELKTPELLQRYRSYKVLLEKYGKTKTEKTKNVSYVQLKEALMRIHDAMITFNLDEADHTMAELEQCEFPDDMQEMMEELKVYLTDIAIDDVIRITEDMCEKLSEENVK